MQTTCKGLGPKGSMAPQCSVGVRLLRQHYAIGVVMLLLTQREAANVLRLSQRTIERLRVSGVGPKFIRCGGRA